MGLFGGLSPAGTGIGVRAALFKRVAAMVIAIAVLCGTSVFSEGYPKAQRRILGQYKTFGELSPAEKEEYLKAIGDKSVKVSGKVRAPYDHTEHQFGYLPFTGGTQTLQEIIPARSVTADRSLSSIDIRLDRLRVFDYPGDGIHKVMLTFEAANHLVNTNQENVSFSQVYEVQEKQAAGVAGYPIFIGLNIGKNGAAFKSATINVKNNNDEKALAVLKSKEFQNGLTLLTTTQPAIKPFTALGTGIAEMILSRNQNRKVQEFFLGLDFDNGASYGARMAVGNYIVVQAPDSEFRWDRWSYDPVNGRIVNKKDPSKGDFPFNYLIFRVSKHETAAKQTVHK